MLASRRKKSRISCPSIPPRDGICKARDLFTELEEYLSGHPRDPRHKNVPVHGFVGKNDSKHLTIFKQECQFKSEEGLDQWRG